MSGVEEQTGLNNPFARNISNQSKKVQPPSQKIDTARENVKKQLTEAFEVVSDNIDEEKLTVEQLVNELENLIFELSGKNSKDKAYREKAKKILTRVKGTRNSFIRIILRKSQISLSELCKLPDKQLNDDSYFEKFNTGSNSIKENKPKGGVRPPALKAIPVHSIDLSNTATGIDDYFNKTETPHQTEESQGKIDPVTEDNINTNSIGASIPNLDTNPLESPVVQTTIENNFNSNINDDSLSNKVIHTEIETNSVKTDTFSIREETYTVQAEVGRISPKETKAKSIQSIQFKPPNKNNLNNQTFDLGVNTTAKQKENLSDSNALNTTFDESNTTKSNLKQSDKLKELKELMEKQKQGKNMNMPVNRSKPQAKTISNTNSIAVQDIKTNENESIITTSSIILSNKNEVKNEIEDIHIPNEVKQVEETIVSDLKNKEEPIIKEVPKPKNPFESPDEKKIDNVKSSTNAPTNTSVKSSFNPGSINKFINKNVSALPLKPNSNLNNKLVVPSKIKLSSEEQNNNIFDSDSKFLSNNDTTTQENQESSKNRVNETQPRIDQSQTKINPFEKEIPSQEEVRNLKSNLTNIEVTEKKDEKEVKITSTPTSPKLDTRSCYTYSNAKVIHQTRESFSNLKEKYKNFSETKVSLETSLELANKKCEIYEKELLSLRKTLNEVKFQFSKTNEESFKLEITRLKQAVSSRDKDNEVLMKENLALKQQLKKYEENLQNMIEENKKFRTETEKKIIQYNKEIESFTRKSNAFEEERKEKEETENLNINTNFNYNLSYTHSNTNTNTYYSTSQVNDHQTNNFKRENKKKQNQQIENANNIVNFNAQETNTSNIPEEPELENLQKEIKTDEKMLHNVNEPERNYEYVYDEYNDNYYNNNFTNGNPNIIEEVGSDNYLNMNGNTYDEMKDFKDDNLQDHQYFESVTSTQNHNEPQSDYNFNNQKANTGDDFSNVNKNVNNMFSINSKGESGATNTNIFSSKSLINLDSEDNNAETENPFENLLKKETNKPKDTKSGKVAEKKNASKVNSHTNSLSMVNKNTSKSKNILEENAFDIFEQSDNAENIFETFSSVKPKTTDTNNLFDC